MKGMVFGDFASTSVHTVKKETIFFKGCFLSTKLIEVFFNVEDSYFAECQI